MKIIVYDKQFVHEHADTTHTCTNTRKGVTKQKKRIVFEILETCTGYLRKEPEVSNQKYQTSSSINHLFMETSFLKKKRV